MSISIEPAAPNIPRPRRSAEDSAAREFFDFEENGAVPKILSATDFHWLKVALDAMGSTDPFLTAYRKTFEDRCALLSRIAEKTLPKLENERDDFRTLAAAAQIAVEKFSVSKGGSQDIERVINDTMDGNPDPVTGYKGYRIVVKQSQRKLFTEERGTLAKLAEADTGMTIVDGDKETLAQMGYINPFVLDACVQGFRQLKHETLVLIKKVDTVWRERNEAARKFEERWDCLNFTLGKPIYRRVVPGQDFYFGTWVYSAYRWYTGGYLKEEDRDIPDEAGETAFGFAPPALPPAPVNWLAVCGKMWRLYWIEQALNTLKQNPKTNEKEIKACLHYQQLFKGHNAVVAADLDLQYRADMLEQFAEEARKGFALLTKSIIDTSDSIDRMAAAPEAANKNRRDQEIIRTKLLPEFFRSNRQETERVLERTDERNAIIRKIDRYIADFYPVSDPDRLGKSLEAMGFVLQASGFASAYARALERHTKASVWKSTLIEAWKKLEASRSETRYRYDYLEDTVNNHFIRRWEWTFYLKRKLIGDSPIDRKAVAPLRPPQENVDDDGDPEADLQVQG